MTASSISTAIESPQPASVTEPGTASTKQSYLVLGPHTAGPIIERFYDFDWKRPDSGPSFSISEKEFCRLLFAVVLVMF